jgi:hypothetical protein
VYAYSVLWLGSPPPSSSLSSSLLLQTIATSYTVLFQTHTYKVHQPNSPSFSRSVHSTPPCTYPSQDLFYSPVFHFLSACSLFKGFSPWYFMHKCTAIRLTLSITLLFSSSSPYYSTAFSVVCTPSSHTEARCFSITHSTILFLSLFPLVP